MKIRFLFLLSLLAFAVYSCSIDGVNNQVLGENTETPVDEDGQPHPPDSEGVLETEPEAKPEIDGDTESIEDSDGNTPENNVPVTVKNDRMPTLVFNELRTEYSSPKVEFIEFLTLEPGNLEAMRLFIAGHSLSKPAYEFPPAEVEAGELIVLHLRSIEEECVDETGEELDLSGGTEAQINARDFWIPGNAKLLRKTDALWISDQDDRIIDAVLLSESSGSRWSSEQVAQAAEFLAREKAWLPRSTDSDENWIPSPADAVITTGTTNTRTICRDETIPPEPRAVNWYITATSSATPGEPNNPKRY